MQFGHREANSVVVPDPCVEQRIDVLGGLVTHPPQHLTGAARRLLAYLAIRGPEVQRSLMCMHLWPELPEERGRANLRRALWQLPPGWVATSGWEIHLLAVVDLAEAQQVAARASTTVLESAQLDLLRLDILPGWYEDWLAPAQDQFHLQRIQALEAASLVAARNGRFAIATTAGLAAVSAEPLRESAVLALVRAHLAEGNRYEAVRRYREYARLLRRELDVAPGPELGRLIAPMLGNVNADQRVPPPRRPPSVALPETPNHR